MAKLRLAVGRGHVEELARLRHPVGAVEELIWNSLDADAENVTVVLERNDFDGVDRVAVIDDGTGIAAEKCSDYFEQIGTSWKKRTQVSEVKKRVLHGKNGRGRVRAFALGSEVRWTSVSGMQGIRRRVVIESDRGSMDEFDVSDPEPTADATGTVFEAFGGEDLQKLTEDAARTALTAAFALHLEAYPDICRTIRSATSPSPIGHRRGPLPRYWPKPGSECVSTSVPAPTSAVVSSSTRGVRKASTRIQASRPTTRSARSARPSTPWRPRSSGTCRRARGPRRCPSRFCAPS
ncbi:ATP-binding protein [Streptomyces caelestis]|jgi:hypothetical protein|uniref:Histidine kinase/HSP90-like ATPase domain-containing protein n=1 Tax=Streptomyces caelestis TaxID=36816 RepID=A0A7W9H8K7_9ACTN|nr:ATP-binding protein [Streptomyces caelestis]MBB5797289.1 hypothetical protein [Streptomyces caelestis]GGW37114.1 hypothetical protein GCM10010320_15830 [Streptomyces caelestis]